jgi:hypothetical protein
MLSTDNEILPEAIAEKMSVPKIDFTLFTTGDGTVVSTKERIIKGTKKKKRSSYIFMKQQFLIFLL